MWVVGPYPAGNFPDLRIYCDGLRGHVVTGERAIAENGYADAIDIFQADAGDFQITTAQLGRLKKHCPAD